MKIGYLWIGIEAIASIFYIMEWGFASLVIECLITGIIGFILVFRIGLFHMLNQLSFYGFRNIFSFFGYGLGGVLLFLPGIISDIVGLFIVIIAFIFSINNSPKNTQYHGFSYSKQEDSDIIDVEVVEDRKEIR